MKTVLRILVPIALSVFGAGCRTAGPYAVLRGCDNCTVTFSGCRTDAEQGKSVPVNATVPVPLK